MRKAEVEKYKNLLENEGYHIIMERRRGGIYIEIKKRKKRISHCNKHMEVSL